MKNSSKELLEEIKKISNTNLFMNISNFNKIEIIDNTELINESEEKLRKISVSLYNQSSSFVTRESIVQKIMLVFLDKYFNNKNKYLSVLKIKDIEKIICNLEFSLSIDLDVDSQSEKAFSAHYIKAIILINCFFKFLLYEEIIISTNSVQLNKVFFIEENTMYISVPICTARLFIYYLENYFHSKSNVFLNLLSPIFPNQYQIQEIQDPIQKNFILLINEVRRNFIFVSNLPLDEKIENKDNKKDYLNHTLFNILELIITKLESPFCKKLNEESLTCFKQVIKLILENEKLKDLIDLNKEIEGKVSFLTLAIKLKDSELISLFIKHKDTLSSNEIQEIDSIFKSNTENKDDFKQKTIKSLKEMDANKLNQIIKSNNQYNLDIIKFFIDNDIIDINSNQFVKRYEEKSNKFNYFSFIIQAIYENAPDNVIEYLLQHEKLDLSVSDHFILGRILYMGNKNAFNIFCNKLSKLDSEKQKEILNSQCPKGAKCILYPFLALSSLSVENKSQEIINQEITKKNNITDITKILLEKFGSLIDLEVNLKGSTPLIYAIKLKDLELITVFIEQGSKIDTKINKSENDIFDLLLRSKDTNFIKEVLEILYKAPKDSDIKQKNIQFILNSQDKIEKLIEESEFSEEEKNNLAKFIKEEFSPNVAKELELLNAYKLEFSSDKTVNLKYKNLDQKDQKDQDQNEDQLEINANKQFKDEPKSESLESQNALELQNEPESESLKSQNELEVQALQEAAGDLDSSQDFN